MSRAVWSQPGRELDLVPCCALVFSEDVLGALVWPSMKSQYGPSYRPQLLRQLHAAMAVRFLGSCCGINNVAPQANHLQSSLISFYSLWVFESAHRHQKVNQSCFDWRVFATLHGYLGQSLWISVVVPRFKEGDQSVVPAVIRTHTPLPPWEGLCQVTGAGRSSSHSGWCTFHPSWQHGTNTLLSQREEVWLSYVSCGLLLWMSCRRSSGRTECQARCYKFFRDMQELTVITLECNQNNCTKTLWMTWSRSCSKQITRNATRLKQSAFP